MKAIIRILQRLIIVAVSVVMMWLVVSQIFERLDDRLPVFVALLITYFVAAYLILPKTINLTLLIIRKGRIPRFTRASDGLEVDPVNLILLGNKNQLEKAFEKIGWFGADKITVKSSIKMGVAFAFKRPYNQAPFKRLFLFGRKQDVGFQQPVNNNPRNRHHIRFWATNVENLIDPMDIKFWSKKQKIDRLKATVWVGAGSQDVGFSITKFTYQLSHKVDPKVDKERDYILESLKSAKCIGEVGFYEAGKFRVGKYVSDGKIAVAELIN